MAPNQAAIEQSVNAALQMAHRHRQSVETRIGEALLVLVQPIEGHVLLMLGVGGGRHAEDILRRRMLDPARFGAWLPARLQDGALVLARRLPVAGGTPGLPASDLAALLELAA